MQCDIWVFGINKTSVYKFVWLKTNLVDFPTLTLVWELVSMKYIISIFFKSLDQSLQSYILIKNMLP